MKSIEKHFSICEGTEWFLRSFQTPGSIGRIWRRRSLPGFCTPSCNKIFLVDIFHLSAVIQI